eukprot:337982-Chlamydomonas_euryale.AAC.1
MAEADPSLPLPCIVAWLDPPCCCHSCQHLALPGCCHACQQFVTPCCCRAYLQLALRCCSHACLQLILAKYVSSLSCHANSMYGCIWPLCCCLTRGRADVRSRNRARQVPLP